MDITLDKKSTTDGLIKIKLSQSDYQPKVEEKIKDYARKANIKGFRQGKVPHGVIKKMFGKSILVDEVNHLLSHSVSDYIKSNKLRILGEPLPNQEKANQIDWDTQSEFEFEFQIGLVDDFTYELSPKVKLKSYPIEVDKKVINDTVADLKKRFGEVTHPEVSEEGDNLHGQVLETGSETPVSAHLELPKLNKKVAKDFVGKKKEDSIEMDIRKVFETDEEVGTFLGISPEEAKTKNGKYNFQITSISRVAPAEINQELFDKVFGKDAVKSEEEFLAKVKETIQGNYDRETAHLLDHEIQHHFVDNTKINMPDEFLKVWLKNSGGDKITDEILEKEFGQYKESLKWDLIKNKISEDLKVVVEAEEVKTKAKAMIMEQFGGQAFAAQLGDQLDDIADNYLSDQEGKNFMKLYDELRHEKILKTIKETATISEKPVSLDEFKKIVEKHNH
ncbi:MAG: trigger factor [Cyclobacteriaceae bacterium]